MPPAQKPAGAEGAERALSRDQPAAADAAVPTPANKGSASAVDAEVISKEHQQNPLGNDDLLKMTILLWVAGAAGRRVCGHNGHSRNGVLKYASLGTVAGYS